MAVAADLSADVYAYVQDHAHVFLVLLDAQGKVIQCNQYAQDLLGRPLAGRHAAELFFDSFWPDRFDQILREGQGECLLNVQTHTGLYESLCVWFSRCEGGILALGHIDTLEIGRLREQLMHLNNRLSALGRELAKKNHALSRASGLKDRFLGDTAHDLRSPLGAIVMSADELLGDASITVGPEQKELLLTIRQNSRFMVRLIEDLSDISRIESGQLALDLQPTDLAALLLQHVPLHRPAAEKKQIEVCLRVAPSLGLVYVDRPRMMQVLSNLIGNAVKFSHQGSKVEVAAWQEPGRVILTVTDHGVGIPPEEHVKLFKPFGRTSARSTAGEQSTGLGLSIARGIVLAHHGEIWVDSQPGAGSTFSVSLPLAEGEQKTGANDEPLSAAYGPASR